MAAPDPYWTTDQLAKRFGVTAATVRRWIRKGQLQADHLPGQYRVTEDAVLMMLRGRQ